MYVYIYIYIYIYIHEIGTGAMGTWPSRETLYCLTSCMLFFLVVSILCMFN